MTKVKELVKTLQADGWVLVRTKKHRIFEHPTKQPLNGRPLAVSKHDSDDILIATLNNILKNAGLK